MRRTPGGGRGETEASIAGVSAPPDLPPPDPRPAAGGGGHARSTWLFGRLLGLTFLIAFVSFHVQLEGLVGERGIVPAARLLEVFSARGDGFWDAPSLAWLIGADDAGLHTICVLGEIASLALFAGALPGPSALIAAFLYLSIVSVGGPFMSFQWDALLVEGGFLAALLLPWQPFHHPRRLREPPALARWALYLLVFRLMFLSGVVKLASGDPAWSSLGALEYHYWSQPLPNPLSWFAHQLPDALHSVATGLTLVIEIGLPFAIVLGRVGRRVAFAGFLSLMLAVGLTGNYGFFNLLAVALSLPLLDDAAIERLTPRRARGWLGAAIDALPRWRARARLAIAVPVVALAALGVLQIFVSLGAGARLPSWAIAPLDEVTPYRLVNGYGLFAVMTKERREITLEGSLDGQTWRAYRFPYKPGDPTEAPPEAFFHMPRLDWQMWFAALGPFRQSPWLGNLMMRLLEAEPDVLALFEDDPFDGRAPRFVRARIADYRFGDWELLAEEGTWWRVEELGPYAPTFQRRE